ncbi:hypothetical protein Pcinc_012377 [Petrolisthes cinctipes]|uniref:Uncharacterized protein n=1 Tax=Petrolisthes cinctipes TaxID=88211 RepID=A0AAE1KRK4_PETCI|nr:hypothetical protein Pcinc_012377 [Petrolisthes cinctipes]
MFMDVGAVGSESDEGVFAQSKLAELLKEKQANLPPAEPLPADPTAHPISGPPLQHPAAAWSSGGRGYGMLCSSQPPQKFESQQRCGRL